MVGKVCGVGVNDLPRGSIGRVKPDFYRLWAGMINRCYNPAIHEIQHTYEGCEVAEEWLLLSNFKEYYNKNYVDSYELDKDLIQLGNKVYGPENCIFVPKWLNLFVKPNTKTTGVSFNKQHKKFAAYGQDPMLGKKILLGYFSTIEQAHTAWLVHKLGIARSYKDFCDSIDARLYDGIVAKITTEI